MSMPERSSKPPSDVNELASAIVKAATSDEPGVAMPITPDGKNAAAVALGRIGGKKGGPARAAKLSKSRRRQIAQKAAQARWGKMKAEVQP